MSEELDRKIREALARGVKPRLVVSFVPRWFKWP